MHHVAKITEICFTAAELGVENIPYVRHIDKIVCAFTVSRAAAHRE